MTGQSKRLHKILMNLELGTDGIYSSNFSNSDQGTEIALREAVADVYYDDYLETISRHHSISVMDWEVSWILRNLQKEAIILDVVAAGDGTGVRFHRIVRI